MGGNLRRTGVFQNPVVCMAGHLCFYFFHDLNAGNLGRTVLLPGTGVHSVIAFGGKHGIYPRDPAESLQNGEMDQPGDPGGDHHSTSLCLSIPRRAASTGITAGSTTWECMASDFCFCLWPSAWREQRVEPRKVCYSLHRFCLP